MDKVDTISLDVPTFIRLLELAREEVKTDMELHYIAEICTKLSKTHTITMEDYDEIYSFSMNETKEAQLENIRRLCGL